MSLSHCRRYVPRLEVLLGDRTASQVTPFHASCSHYRQCNSWLLAFGETPLSFNYPSRFVCDLVTQWENVRYLNSPYVAVLYLKRQPNYNHMYTMDHTFSYHSQKNICAYAKLSAHAHGTEFRVEISIAHAR